ncbi:MAG: hypothetical protein ABI067_03390 [Leifsonia sp.]
MTYTIVVGVNDSLPARAAAGWAAIRATTNGGPAELVLVHVLATVDDLPTEVLNGLDEAGKALLVDVAVR